MKRILFWVTTPITLSVFLLVSLLGALFEGCAEACHKWEAWCLDYKSLYPAMHYKGGGVWTSYKELP